MTKEQPKPVGNDSRLRAEIKAGELSDAFIGQLLIEVAQAKEDGRLVIPRTVGIIFDESSHPIFLSQVAILEPDEPELFDITKNDGITRIVVNDPTNTKRVLKQADKARLASALVAVLSEISQPQ